MRRRHRDVGPVISGAAQADIAEGIERTPGHRAGRCWPAAGATSDSPLSEGHFLAPTVVELAGPADIWQTELFGPVLAVRRAADTRV